MSYEAFGDDSESVMTEKEIERAQDRVVELFADDEMSEVDAVEKLMDLGLTPEAIRHRLKQAVQ